MYIKMAARIYGCQEEDVTKDQRFVGKTTILGAGYGMGARSLAAAKDVWVRGDLMKPSGS